MQNKAKFDGKPVTFVLFKVLAIHILICRVNDPNPISSYDI